MDRVLDDSILLLLNKLILNVLLLGIINEVQKLKMKVNSVLMFVIAASILGKKIVQFTDNNQLLIALNDNLYILLIPKHTDFFLKKKLAI